MPILTIKQAKEEHIEFNSGLSIKDILDMTNNYRVRAGCRGLGACGLCKVKIEKGTVKPLEKTEKLQLSQTEQQSNIRLACQIKPENNLLISIVNPALASKWKNSIEKAYQSSYPISNDFFHNKAVSEFLGVAVDLGTTNITVAVFDLKNGKELVRRTGLNPQSFFGADVISRLTAACEKSKNHNQMQEMIINALDEALTDISSREGIALKNVLKLKLVGNTAMLSILSGQNYASLLNPKFWNSYVDCLPKNTKTWIDKWHLNSETDITVIRPLSGFVGSDLIAGIITTRMADHKTPALLIDFGTNSEITLWNGERFFVTAAAGGPAFEGSGVSNGMPADEGAIFRANLDSHYQWSFKTILNKRPKGICGSGLVDIISMLLSHDLLNKTGNFSDKDCGNKFILPLPESDISITKNDIDLIQRAKAAISAGIIVLCRNANIKISDIDRVFIGGAFGHYLNIKNAQTIGLIPQIPEKKVQICGNTALAGCADIVLSDIAAQISDNIYKNVNYINLSAFPDFDDLFFENLFLKPMGGI
ncbi:ferredoxin [Candidatus Magnetomorum sp. HK-1]|nr:ferredoxin [Candidatus Magnetomorum sp. HK-1]